MNLKINDKAVDFFNSFSIGLAYNSIMSDFAFKSFFNPENQDHKDIFKPLTYPEVKVEHEGELLITGTLIKNTLTEAPADELIDIGGYSLTGVLEDCEIPVGLYPLQNVGLSLRQIVQKIIKPFGLKIKVDDLVSGDMDKVYRSSTANENQSIKSYLDTLASQRNIVMSHTTKGELLFTRPNTSKAPIADFTEGLKTRMELSIDGQAMHSSITVYREADSEGGNSGQTTIDNPLVSVYRPKVKTQSAGNDVSTSEAARTALAEELKSIKLTIQTDRWTVDDKIIRPNEIITVTSPRLYLYNKTRWFIESVRLMGDNTQTTALITCGLPEVYDRKTPKNIFE
jgi:prophage tail gpP-like protein